MHSPQPDRGPAKDDSHPRVVFGTYYALTTCLVFIVAALIATWLLAGTSLVVKALLVLAAIVVGVFLLNVSAAWLDTLVMRRRLRRLGRLALGARGTDDIERGRALARALEEGEPHLMHVSEFAKALEHSGPLQLYCLRVVIAASPNDNPYFQAFETAARVLEEGDFEPLVRKLAPLAHYEHSEELARVLGRVLEVAPPSRQPELVDRAFAWAPKTPRPAWLEAFRPFKAQLVAIKAEPRAPELGPKASAYLEALR
jgi:hypothetical protein